MPEEKDLRCKCGGKLKKQGDQYVCDNQHCHKKAYEEDAQ